MRRPHSFFPQPSNRGFTLVEMLVATAVLVLLIVLVAQLTNSATMTITSSRKHLDADAQARLIFDRMGNDFANMLKRKDVDYILKTGTNPQNNHPSLDEQMLDGGNSPYYGNDAMYFFSEAPAYSGTNSNAATRNSVALVGYRINTANPYALNTPVLERLGKTLTWDQAPPTGMVFLTGTAGTIAPPAGSKSTYGNWGATVGDATSNYSNGTDADFHVLGDSVYRFEYTYLLKPFTASSPVTVSGSTYSAGQVVPARISNIPWDTFQNHSTISGLQDVSAIIVGLGILDSNSRKTVTNYNKLMTSLPDASGTADIMQSWKTAVSGTTGQQTNPYKANTGLNSTAFSQLRYYQRYFYLNN